ncbi:MAG: DMT family transporter [Rhodocyclaceae bacterium]|nr:MAG: DMT family transporter [Rhodocyclaceae bacterium]
MPGAAKRLDLRAVFLMIGLCSIWGIQQIAIKITGVAIPPLTQCALRSIGATVLLLFWCRQRGDALFNRDASLLPGVAIALLFSVEFALIFAGLSYTTASRGILFLYTAPFFVAACAPLFLAGERLRKQQWLGLIAAFGGIASLFGDDGGNLRSDHWKGDLMMLGAAILWAATTLTIKGSQLQRISSNKVLFYQLAGSALLLPLFALALGERPSLNWSSTAALWMGYQTVMVGFISYIAWFWLIKHYSATRLSAFSFLTPLLGVLAGNLMLREALTHAVLLALVLVAGGIAVVNLSAGPPSPDP